MAMREQPAGTMATPSRPTRRQWPERGWRRGVAASRLLLLGFCVMQPGAVDPVWADVLLRGPAADRPGLLAAPFAGMPAEAEPLLAQRAIESGRGGPKAGDTPDARVTKPTGRKSPALAGLLSAVVPGAGQAYLHNQSGYAFFGVEVAAWLAHFSLRDTGKDKEREYKRFADGHWSFERYRDPNSGPCTADGHSDRGVQDSTLVFLYDTRRDDWYEDIGKLTIYSCGWDSPANRLFYRDLRNDSNDFLRAARYATSVILLNHIVSALAAAKGAASHNQHLTGGLELQIDLQASLVRPGATVALRQTF